MKPEQLNGADLAFIGDAYFELSVRKYLLTKNITRLHDLHRYAVKFVSAKGHHVIVRELEKSFTEEEQMIFKRGRNHKYNISGRNVNKEEYVNSSGFEALIGYLYLKENYQRLDELINQAIRIIEDTHE